MCELRHELHFTPINERINDFVGYLSNSWLKRSDMAGREETVDKPFVPGVVGWVIRKDLVAKWLLCAPFS
tara:strand:- start:389 stop:598 length:210 start_codon:yes stop_codon:yes gene_type:complete